MKRETWGQLTEGEHRIDWGRTAADYARYRPDYPETFYARMSALGVGLEGQRILDLATGPGFLAHRFARQGAEVSALDVAAGQVEQARASAQAQGLEVAWHTSAAEDLSAFASSSFDRVVAGQCWWYFDHESLLSEVARVLRPEGRLVVVFFNWLVSASRLIAATEALIRKHNPAWGAWGWDGSIAPELEGIDPALWHREMLLVFDQDIAFDHAGWRGRIRASRGVGASLDAAGVEAFDGEHAEMLATMVPERFDVPHRVAAYWYRPRHHTNASEERTHGR